MEGSGCSGYVGTNHVNESQQWRWGRATGRAASCANGGGGSMRWHYIIVEVGAVGCWGGH
jgi:hypothetical protein